MLSRLEIFQLNDIEIEKVELLAPYKGEIYIRTMTGEEWDQFQESIIVDGPKGKKEVQLKNSKAKLIVHSACDQDGNLMFTPSDIPELCKKSTKFLELLATSIQKLNGMSSEEKDKKN